LEGSGGGGLAGTFWQMGGGPKTYVIGLPLINNNLSSDLRAGSAITGAFID